MTESRRSDILSQDSLSIADVMDLNPGLSYSSAAKMIRRFKIQSGKGAIRGRISTTDYLAGINGNLERRDDEKHDKEIRSYSTVCLPR